MRRPGALVPPRRLAARMLLLAGLGLSGAGCGWIVTQSEFDKEREHTRGQFETVRNELLAHTQILANHGKAINEVRLQMRDVLTGQPAGTTARDIPQEVRPGPAAPPEAKPPAQAPAGRTLYVRSTYQGLPLNYAAGYRAPRGPRLPFRLAPGTPVRTVSGDQQGFTQVEVLSGPHKGKKMWVRTRWLAGERG